MSDQEKPEKDGIQEENTNGQNTDIKAENKDNSAEKAVEEPAADNNGGWEAKADEMNYK